MEPEQRGRDMHQMDCFPCNGVFHVVQQDGDFYCMLKHSLNHVQYKDISIPEKWCKFIMDNYMLGPTKVSIPCFIQLVIAK